MADAATISVLIQARDQASAQLKTVETRMGSLAQSFGKHRRSIGLAATAIGGAIVGIGVLSVKSSLDQQVGINRLDQSLKNVGTSYANQKIQIEKVVAAQQLKTNYGDEAQREALQKLVTIGGKWEGSLAALKVTTDVAAGANIDLNAAALLVGKAIAGETSSLSRYGIILEKGATQTEIMAALTSQFGGAAEAAADPITQMKNRMGDLFQVLGDALLPVLEALLPMIEKATRRVIEWAEAHPTLTKVLALVGTAIGAILLVLGPLLLILPTLVAGIGLVSAAFVALNLSMGPITLAIIAIAALVAAAIIVWKKWDDMSTKVKVAVVLLGIALGPITGIIVLGIAAWKNWDKIVDIVRKTISTFTRQVIGFIIKLGEGFLAITKWIPGMGDTRRAIEETMGTLRNSQDTVDEWGQNTGRRLEEQAEAWGALEDSHHSSTEQMNEHMEGTALVTERVAESIEGDQAKIAEAAKTTATAVAKSGEAMALAWGGMEDAMMQVAIKQKETLEAQAAEQDRFDALQKLSRDSRRSVFLEKLEDFRKEKEVEAQTRQAISDSWSTFKQDQDVTMQALKASNIDFIDVVEQLAIRHDVSVSQMADRLAAEGVRMNDTWGLVQQQGAEGMRGLINEIETASQTVAEKMSGLGRIMSGTSFTDPSGASLGFDPSSMATITGMSAEDKLAALTGEGKGAFSTENLGQLISTSGPGVAQEAASALIMERYAGNEERIANELALQNGGFGEPDSSVRKAARNRINEHMEMLRKSSPERWGHLKLLNRDMTDASRWQQPQALNQARQLASQVGGMQGNLMALYASGGVTAFAQGGIVRRPTMGLIGEAGPEAVIPLGRGGGMGQTNNFHFHGSVYGVEDLKEAVVEAVRDHAISGGFSGVFAEA